MYAIKFGSMYLTTENSFAGKMRAAVLTLDQVWEWMTENHDLFFGYDMRIVLL